MEIAVSEQQGIVPVTVYRIKGDIDGNTYRLLEDQAKASIAAGTRYLLLDLTDVPFMSSAGLRALHSIFAWLSSEEASDEAAKQRNAGLLAGTYKSPYLKLYKPSKRVLQAMSLAGYDMFLEVFDDFQNALDSFWLDFLAKQPGSERSPMPQ